MIPGVVFHVYGRWVGIRLMYLSGRFSGPIAMGSACTFCLEM